MEKPTPHCKLSRVFELIDLQQVRTTFTAQTGAAALGLGFDDMVLAVRGLKSDDFYKSMTTHADHRVWQDVYRTQVSAPLGTVRVYLKLTVIDEVLIVSFKEQQA